MNRRDAIKQTALMMGYAVSASVVSGVMSGCQATESMDWTPSAMSQSQGEIVAQVAECILPASDTPGAKDVFVHEFIDTMLGTYMKPEEKTRFLAGVDQVEADAQSAHGKSFMSLSAEEQNALLVKMAKDTEAAIEADPSLRQNKPFFMQMKELTLTGYFTSERIGKEFLVFDPVPGRYDGCMPLEEVNNTNWTI